MTDVLEQIKNAISIVDVVQEKVPLNKKGREYLGLCPFHHEKTPSFYVNPQKGFYYCFGCQAKGNIFNFYVELYKLSFPEAVKALAQKANITLPSNYSVKQDPKINALYTICNLAQDYFHKQLLSANGKMALEYLHNRGISLDLIKQFNLGFSPKDNSSLWEICQQHKFYDEYLLEIGLQGYSEKGFLYSFFQNRVIFPIRNTQGKVIAFGGRCLANEQPKYLNSKESTIFAKRANIYGLSQSLVNLKNNNLIVVEGYMDVVSLYKYGYNTAVACLGTAITPEHIVLLNKYDKAPIFCLDGDTAGQKATDRVLDLYLSTLNIGVNPQFVFLPNGEDPDSFLAKHGVEGFNSQLENAKGISEVLWLQATLNKNINLPEVSASVLQDLQNRIKVIPDSNLRYQFNSYFKENLYQYGKVGKARLPINKQVIKKEDYKVNANYIRDGILIGCVLLFPIILPDIEEELGNLIFTNATLEKIREYLIERVAQGEDLQLEQGLQADIEYLLNLNLIKPVMDNILTPQDALNKFFETYKLVQKENFEFFLKEIRNKLLQITQDLKNVNDETTKNAMYSQVEALLAEQQEIRKQIEQLTSV
ncbi:DNA primase [Candidatus Hepatincola sp. Av]